MNKSNTIYFGADNGAFVLKRGSKKPEPINGIGGNIYSIAVDKNNNVYVGTETVGNGLFKLQSGSRLLKPK